MSIVDPCAITEEMIFDFRESFQRWGMSGMFISIVATRLNIEKLISPPVYCLLDPEGWPVKMFNGDPLITPNKNSELPARHSLLHFDGDPEP